MFTLERSTRSLSVAVAVAVVLSLLTIVSAGVEPARAEVRAASFTTESIGALDPIPGSVWGVSGLTPAETQTPSLDVLVWAFATIGDRVFVGGAFENVQESRTATPIPQPFLAAFDADTGDWISDWTPRLDRAVYALDVLPNGSLLVGGEFETVNGFDRAGLVALDPLTGAIDRSFAGGLDRRWSPLRAQVRDLEVLDGQVYVGGNFSHVSYDDGSRSRSFKAARLDASTGRHDPTWAPVVSGSGVWGLAVDPDRGEVHLAGYFSSVNAEAATDFFHTVDTTTGATVAGKLPLPRNDPFGQRDVFDVEVGDGLVFVAGAQHVLQVLDADDHRMIGYHTTGIGRDGFEWAQGFAGGDFQVVERIGDVILAGCHCTFGLRYGIQAHYSSFTQQRSTHRLVMAYDAATGELIEDFRPDVYALIDGTWAVGADNNGCLYVGGDFHTGGVDNGASRWLGGFARLCEPEPDRTSLLVEARSAWRYLDDGAPPVGWTEPGFDDGAWPEGEGELGFGDSDTVTALTPGRSSYAFRHRFDFSGPLPPSLDLRLKADDGAVVYLNGVEVARDNLPEGTVGPDVPASTWKTGPAEDFQSFTIPADALVEGENVLAVSVHNVWSGNGDLGFDLRLDRSETVLVPPEPEPEPLVALGSTWSYGDSSPGRAPLSWPRMLDTEVAAPVGPAPLGFGRGDEATELVAGQETYYFARSFELDQVTLDALTAAEATILTLQVDDGAVVYLNGVEVTRVNLPAGPIAWNTRPTQWVAAPDDGPVDYEIPLDGLVLGTNTVTVEVHNYWPGNRDLRFDLALTRPETPDVPVPDPAP